MLATIRRDAPIDFTVPTVSWHEALDGEKVLALLLNSGFVRSLIA